MRQARDIDMNAKIGGAVAVDVSFKKMVGVAQLAGDVAERGAADITKGLVTGDLRVGIDARERRCGPLGRS